MSAPDLDKLRAIKTIPSLVKYLRDDLDWPIETDHFDEIFYEYEAEELGIDKKTAAKIDSIQQLRKLTDDQPWGIFIIKFEPRRLPVVALRRVLQSLVVKQRQSANKSELATWNLHDLLFISTYGEEKERHINFAHFSEDESENLPTLRVLGWDEDDTPLHLDKVHHDLSDKLRWPNDKATIDEWRNQWSSAFTLKHREVVTTSKQLALRLAALATVIRKRVNAILAIESEDGPIRKLMASFKEALIHDLNEDDFADMYAQTISYGLLTARISRPAGLVADNLADMVPVTNPFLKDLLETFLKIGGRKSTIDFDELGLNDVVELLRNANMEAVLRDFGDKNPDEDPVIHFYEHFLKEYDAKKRMKRGVFYTPQPVVSFIVRSVDELLRKEFSLQDGLADTTTWGQMVSLHMDLKIPNGVSADQAFVQILDPATGTGTFLVEVIDLIHKHMCNKWTKEGRMELELPQLWNDYVPTHLLPRLHGYELMMAPYAIAHMKIGLKLYETGYRFETGERVRVYLTNSLEAPSDKQLTMDLVPALAREANVVNKQKRVKRFAVVIGNPPYAGISSNMSTYAQGLIEPYKRIDGKALNERKHWLQDDYVKFIRMAQSKIDATNYGVLGFITNHSYLDNTTFRGMRQNLLASFSKMFIYDLKGSLKKSNKDTKLVGDENVFDIQQGVAITISSKRGDLPTSVYHASILGSREFKYESLRASSIGSIEKVQLQPVSPYYFVVPRNTQFDFEYGKYQRISDVMPIHVCGITTARDSFVIGFSDAEIKTRLSLFLDDSLSDVEVGKQLGLSENYSWRINKARKEFRARKESDKQFSDILYRPFDIRRIIYDPSIVWRTRAKVMGEFTTGKNIGLCTNRQVNSAFNHAGVTRWMINDCTLSLATKERSYVFPLWLMPHSSNLDLMPDSEKRLNFSEAFLDAFSGNFKTKSREGNGLPAGISGEQILSYFYAVLNSPVYRDRYSEQLKVDYPSVPTLLCPRLFERLSHLGSELISLHLMESLQLNSFVTMIVGSGKFEVEKVTYSDETIWIDKARTKGFHKVKEEVWSFPVGGFQVCEKWLKDRQAKGGKKPRPGRVLTEKDINHYQKVIVAISETIRIMAEIDEVIDSHGGWPDAFVTSQETVLN